MSVFPSEFPRFLLILFIFGLQMLASLKPYVGYVNCSSHSTQNLSFVGWAIYAPNGELVSLQGICISLSTNNIVEYSAMIELLSDAISHGIRHIVIRLDSQLVVLQLTNVFSVRIPTMFRMFMRVLLLERCFDFIQYQHISRNLNTLEDAFPNHVLDRRL